MMKRMTHAVFLALTVWFFTGVGGLANPTAPILVDGNLRSVHWGTVFTNEIDLVWDWDADASTAHLEITSMNGAALTADFTKPVSNYLWQVFASDAPEAEDVYDLKLTFYAGGEAVGVLTSRLAVVHGAFGATAVNAVPNSPAWAKIKENVVIPYSADFSETAADAFSTQLVIAKRNGAVQTNVFEDLAGYYGWKVIRSGWGYGIFDLALTFPGMTNVWTAELVRQMDGVIFKVR
jgi:hypothetical protein